jgi:hypothetical protein
MKERTTLCEVGAVRHYTIPDSVAVHSPYCLLEHGVVSADSRLVRKVSFRPAVAGPSFHDTYRETRATNQCSVCMFQETPLFLGGGLFGPGSFGRQRKRLCTYEGCLTPSCEREGIHVGSAALLGSAKRRTSPDKKCTSPRTSFQCIHYFSDMVG